MEKIYTSIFEDAKNYERARIPGIICTDSGDLIAYCELRKASDDWAVIDVGMKKSTDGGKSWSDRRILVSGDSINTVNNPVMIPDGNIIHFLYCLNYRRVFYMKSTDSGESWSEKTDITDSIKKQTGDFFWSCIATGPTHGIRLLNGRLLVPVWLSFNKEDEKSHHPSVITVLFSDDSGESWLIGEINDNLNDPSEFAVCQLPSGKIIANIRHENNEKYRAVGEITEKGEIRNIHFLNNLPDPVCCAGMCACGNSILFSNCEDKKDRINLTLKKLNESSKTEESIPISLLGGYSDIAVSPDKKSAFILAENKKSLICTTVRL